MAWQMAQHGMSDGMANGMADGMANGMTDGMADNMADEAVREMGCCLINVFSVPHWGILSMGGNTVQ